MKAKIVSEQVQELSDNAKKRLKKWWKIREGDWFFHELHPELELLEGGFLNGYGTKVSGHGESVYPLMDITMMIRFLRDMANRRSLIAEIPMTSEINFPLTMYLEGEGFVDADSFCDDLWGMVKEVLENEDT